jgi:hypothetical protein
MAASITVTVIMARLTAGSGGAATVILLSPAPPRTDRLMGHSTRGVEPKGGACFVLGVLHHDIRPLIVIPDVP